METLQLLGTALGLGALAGLNLYLTVFVAGLAIQMGWVALAPQYAQLHVLADPTIIVIAGVLYALEFFADKIPWVDSLWDMVHSLIRPIGGAFLGVAALGTASPVFDVVIGLLAGSVALSTHSLKAGARLVANSSPEPVSNVILSVAEDATVVGGLALVYLHPAIALVLVLATAGLVFYFGPRIARSIRAKAWLAWRKLAAPVDKPVAELPRRISADADQLLHELREPPFTVAWAVPCIATGSGGLPRNAFGYLVALEGDAGHLCFVSRGWLRRFTRRVEFAEAKVAHESRFLSENLVLYTVGSAGRKGRTTFCFERSCRLLVARLAETLPAHLRPGEPALPTPAEVA